MTEYALTELMSDGILKRITFMQLLRAGLYPLDIVTAEPGRTKEGSHLWELHLLVSNRFRALRAEFPADQDSCSLQTCNELICRTKAYLENNP